MPKSVRVLLLILLAPIWVPFWLMLMMVGVMLGQPMTWPSMVMQLKYRTPRSRRDEPPQAYVEVTRQDVGRNELAEITVKLPAAVVDRLRGVQSRADWLAEAGLRLARQQSGHDPLDPIGWSEIAAEFGW